MAAGRPFLTADAARARVADDLDVIDAALDRLRATSTDMVGNAFRLDIAERLERHRRMAMALSYRTFGEIMEPPDGVEDPALPAGVKVRDLLCRRLRIMPAEVLRRAKLAARIQPRRSLTGAPIPAELPALAKAIEAGEVGEDHIREVCKALHVLPSVAASEKSRVERTLVRHARTQDAAFVAAVGRRIADTLNPDGLFDDRDRAARRGLILGPQGPDGMSKFSGWVTPECRAYVEAVGAAVRPGHHLPGAESTVVDAATDTRTGSQRLHDAVAWGLRRGIESGALGTHRGIPVTVIVTTTLPQLDQAIHANLDPNVQMPAPARTGGGSSLPMRDLIRMAAGSIHYLVVFDGHSDRPLYLGRSKRVATIDQRVVCHGRDKGCTRPGCAVPGYHSEVHHAPDWEPDGRTDADHLYFSCGPDHKLLTDGHAKTTVTDDGRLAWAVNGDPPEVNRVHHDDELFDDEDVG